TLSKSPPHDSQAWRQARPVRVPSPSQPRRHCSLQSALHFRLGRCAREAASAESDPTPKLVPIAANAPTASPLATSRRDRATASARAQRSNRSWSISSPPHAVLLLW